ncbi:MAG: hypothetical protein ACFFDF_01645 [Candidatus Odinarchaeota archaeon]
MEELDKFNRKFRNSALIMIIIAIILLIFWMIIFLNSPEGAPPLLISISIALLLAGILLITRIQYVIWMKKKNK